MSGNCRAGAWAPRRGCRARSTPDEGDAACRTPATPLEARELDAARAAPRGPDVDHDRVPAQRARPAPEGPCAPPGEQLVGLGVQRGEGAAGRRRAWRAAALARDLARLAAALGALDSGAWLQADDDDRGERDRAEDPWQPAAHPADRVSDRPTRPAHQADECGILRRYSRRRVATVQGSPSRARSPDQPGGSESPGTVARRDSPFSTDSQVMADSMSAAAEAAPIPDQAAIERAEAFTRERFVHDGEDPRGRARPGLRAPPRARRRAGASSTAAPRCPRSSGAASYSLLLGLERLLSEDEPHLADGTRALRPPGRRALGHADRAAGRGQRSATATRAPTATGRRRRARARGAACRADARRATTTTRTTTSDDDDEDDDEDEDEDDEDDEDEPTRSPRTGEDDADESTRTSTRRPRTPTPTSASGSSTRPAPARPSPRWASSRPRAPAAS